MGQNQTISIAGIPNHDGLDVSLCIVINRLSSIDEDLAIIF